MERSESNAGEEPLTDVLAPHRSRTSSLRSLELEEIKGSSITEDVVGFDEIDGGSHKGSSRRKSQSSPRAESDIGLLQESSEVEKHISVKSGVVRPSTLVREAGWKEFFLAICLFIFRPFANRFLQFNVLSYKIFKQNLRSKKALAIYILIPVLFNLVLLFLGFVFPDEDIDKDIRHPSIEGVAGYPRCFPGKTHSSCYSIAHNRMLNQEVVDMVNQIADRNGIPRSEIIRFNSSTQIDMFLFDNPNTTSSGIIVEYNESYFGELQHIPDDSKIIVQLNGSVRSDEFGREIELPALSIVSRAVLENRLERYGLTAPADPSFSIIPFPHPENEKDGGSAGLFLTMALFLPFLIQLNQIVSEKEKGLRFALKIAGLYDSSYWGSWLFHFGVVLNILFSLLFFASGAAVQLEFYLETTFFLTFFYFLVYGLALTAMAYMLSTMVNTSKTGVLIGFSAFLVFIVLGFLTDLIYSEDSPDWVKYLFSSLAPVVFQRGLGLLVAAAAKTTPDQDRITWSNYSTHVDKELFPVSVCFHWMLAETAAYLLIGWFFDNVLSNRNGVGRLPWFFVTRSYWRGKPFIEMRRPGKYEAWVGEDIAVRKEWVTIRNSEFSDSAVVLKGVSKSFSSWFHLKHFRAVNGVSFHIDEGQIFALLGPNGAGKTTIVNMLTGLFQPTRGSASIFGRRLSNIDEIRRMMGVCQQHDVLWDELTAVEHLRVFSVMKGVFGPKIGTECARILKEVNLYDVRDVVCSKFSGGMRRRLSIAIALVGNPRVLLFDEPSTGLDPVSRRHLWKIIENAKRGRAILLTTHSMEEAEFLSDKITIICNGRLRCIGTSMELRAKFGTGYRISVVCQDGSSNSVCNAILEVVPEARFPSVRATTVVAEVPRVSLSEMGPLCQRLEKDRVRLGILDFSVSQPTLLDVFFEIAGKAAEETKGGMNVKVEGANVQRDPLQRRSSLSKDSGL